MSFTTDEQRLIHDAGLLFYRQWQPLKRTWLGHHISKYPTDLFHYQMILHEKRPDVVVETGTYRGGMTAFVCSMMDLIGHGEIISIDYREFDGRPQSPRISYIVGRSTRDDVVDEVRRRVDGRSVMVLLDSTHHSWHVKKELWMYRHLVTPDQYMVVESTYLNGHPIKPDHGPGPMEAVQWFLAHDRRFVADPLEEDFLFSKSPGGWLRRVK